MADRQRKKIRDQYGYEDLSSVDEGGLRRYKQNGKWGLCSPYGKPVTKAIYDHISHFGYVCDWWLAVKNGKKYKIYEDLTVKEQSEPISAPDRRVPKPDWILSL